MSTRVKRRWWPLVVVLVVAGAMWAPGYASAAGTGTIVVCLTDSSGNNVVPDSDKAWYQANGGSINYVGPVGTSGCREQTLTAGASVDVWVKYNATYSDTQTGTVPDGGTLRFDFYTTKVTLQYSNGLAFGGPTGDSTWFLKPSMELLSNSGPETPGVHFRLDGTGGPSGRMLLSWPAATGTGAKYEASLAVARLTDSNGDPLSGGTVAGYSQGWFNVPGATDANGNLAFAHAGLNAITSVAMYYNGTHQQINQSSIANSVYQFQTALAVVKLRDADGNPLDTGSASYYALKWQPAQNTWGGETSFEMLPGHYSFAMTYNHTRQQLNGVAISGPSTDVVFQTGRLTAYFSQPFYWYNSQFYSFPSGQSMEFLPGQIGLQLPVNGCMTPKFAIAAGDHLVKTGIVATLVNSSNQPLSGGTVSWYAGGWHSFTNPTGNNGKTCQAADGHLGVTSVAMVYNGTSVQLNGQNAQTNGIYAFKTTDVTVELRNSGGSLVDTGSASYYAGSWRTIGDTSGGTVHVQMLPGSYSFAMTYLGTSEQLNGQAISGPTSTVTFQTAPVVSDSGNAVSYYATTYWPFTSGMELLPGAYWFQFSDQPQAKYTLYAGQINHIH